MLLTQEVIVPRQGLQQFKLDRITRKGHITKIVLHAIQSSARDRAACRRAAGLARFHQPRRRLLGYILNVSIAELKVTFLNGLTRLLLINNWDKYSVPVRTLAFGDSTCHNCDHTRRTHLMNQGRRT